MSNTQIAAKKRAIFLTELAKCGNVSDACRIASTSRTNVYKWRGLDPEFAAAWDEAIEDAIDTLEREAFRRAMGVAQDIFDKDGQKTGTKVHYSDTLLIFLLKGNRPQKYKERTEVSGTSSQAVTLHVTRQVVEAPALEPGKPNTDV